MKHIRKTQSKAQKNPTGRHYEYGRQGTSQTHILQTCVLQTNMEKTSKKLPQHGSQNGSLFWWSAPWGAPGAPLAPESRFNTNNGAKVLQK